MKIRRPTQGIEEVTLHARLVDAVQLALVGVEVGFT